MPAITPPGLVPIVIGVTGHRDVPEEDVARLSNAVRGLLDHLKREYPNSPCVLVSSLAEGSDRIAARAAIAAGWELGVALPLPVDAFEEDFSSEASVGDFRELLARAAWVHVCRGSHTRPACYADASAWIANHAQTLVALWDGMSPPKEGGASHTVRICLEGPATPRLTLPDTRPVVQVVTRRQGAYAAIAESLVGSVVRHEPRPAGLSSEGEEERWQTIMRRIDEFNRDARRALQRHPEAIAAQRAQLNEGRPFRDEDVTPEAVSASWLHAVAGQISVNTQQRRDRHFRWLIVAALLAILLEQVYSGPVPRPLLLAAALLCGIISFVLYRRGVKQRLEARYIDYRALAEACRVQHFWQCAGLHACAADYFLRDQRDELEWIRQAVLSTELTSNVATKTEVPRAAAIARVRQCWLEDQRRWLVVGGPARPGGKQCENEALSRRLSRKTSRLMLAGVTTIFIVTVFHALFARALGATGEMLTQVLIVTYGMLFVGAAVTKAVQETKAYEEQARRYRRAGLSMTLACRHLDEAMAAGDIAKAEGVVLDAGREALAENNDWLLVHRQRPVKVPIG